MVLNGANTQMSSNRVTKRGYYSACGMFHFELDHHGYSYVLPNPSCYLHRASCHVNHADALPDCARGIYHPSHCSVCGSLVLVNAVMGVVSSLGIFAVLRLTGGEYEARFEGILGWAFAVVIMALSVYSLIVEVRVEVGLPHYALGISNEGLRTLMSCITYRFMIAGIVVASLLDVLTSITLLCVLACVLGVYYAAHREPRLVDTDNRIMVFSVFSGGACAAAKIESMRVDPRMRYPVCKISNARIYRSLSQFDGELRWVRFSKLELNWENAKFDL